MDGGNDRTAAATRILVLGCGDVGSAVAHELFLRGAELLLCDLPRPAHARRGMAYTDTLFDGSCTLEGVAARFAGDVAAVRRCWAEGHDIPLVALPDREVLDALAFDVAIDATMRRDRAPADIRGYAPLVLGLGPGFIPGENCHVAVESQWGAAMGRVLSDRATAPLAGGPRPLDGVGRERFVAAPCNGCWHTSALLGDAIDAGDRLGHLIAADGERVIRAPLAGTLRGVTRDGVEVRQGQRIVEVDPRAQPQIFGIGERPRAIAGGVAHALADLLAPATVRMRGT